MAAEEAEMSPARMGRARASRFTHVVVVLAVAAAGALGASAGEAGFTLGLTGYPSGGGAPDPGSLSGSPELLHLGAEPDALGPEAPPAAPAGASPRSAGVATDATTPGGPTLAVFPRRVARDFGALVTRPLTFDATDWTRLALGAGAVAVVAAFDTRIRTAALADTSGGARTFADRIRPLGTWGGVAAMGVLLGAGELAGDTELARTGADGIEASLFAGAFVAPLVKEIAGRRRPNAGTESGAFEPVSSAQSFPSGEATEAFALAAVVSNHVESPVVRGVAWGLAGLVGWERIALNAHWASDVVAGALIGATVGNWVSRRSWPGEEGGTAIAVRPLVGPGVVGVSGSLSW